MPFERDFNGDLLEVPKILSRWFISSDYTFKLTQGFQFILTPNQSTDYFYLKDINSFPHKVGSATLNLSCQVLQVQKLVEMKLAFLEWVLVAALESSLTGLCFCVEKFGLLFCFSRSDSLFSSHIAKIFLSSGRVSFFKGDRKEGETVTGFLFNELDTSIHVFWASIWVLWFLFPNATLCFVYAAAAATGSTV